MNKVIVIGNLGSDPEMSYTPNGTAVTRFSVASNRRYKMANGEQREEVQWFRVSAFGNLAEVCNQWLEKGRQVYVEGRLTVSPYTDNQGNPRASANLNANEVQFLGGGQQNGNGEQRREPVGAGQPQQRREQRYEDPGQQGYNAPPSQGQDDYYDGDPTDDLPF